VLKVDTRWYSLLQSRKKQKKAKLKGTNTYICAIGISVTLLSAYTFMLTNLNLLYYNTLETALLKFAACGDTTFCK
jgi:hypothetical protein